MKAPQRCLHPIPGTCDYVSSGGKRDFADELGLEMWGLPWIIQGPHVITRVLMREDSRVSKEDVTMEAEVRGTQTLAGRGFTSQGTLAASGSRKWIPPSTCRRNAALPTPGF